MLVPGCWDHLGPPEQLLDACEQMLTTCHKMPRSHKKVKKGQMRLSECSSSSLKAKFNFDGGSLCACAYVHVCACMHLKFRGELHCQSHDIRGYRRADKILLSL